MKYLFTNLLGSFVLDSNANTVNNIVNNTINIYDKIPFSKIEDYFHKEQAEQKLSKKYPDLKPLPPEKLSLALELFKDKQYFEKFRIFNLKLTKQAVKAAVSEDNLIIQASSNISELDKVTNLLTKRLREWYSLYLPELSEKFVNPEKFVEYVAEKNKEELLKELNLSAEESMGAELEKFHIEEIKKLAQEISTLYHLRKEHEAYLVQVMHRYCPNLLGLAGVTIGAKLIELGKSLKHLAMLPASTIQLFGAEKALFRHIKTGSRSPKYGVIINHPLIQNAPKDKKGKASRMLADKLSLCARLDYFHGEFKAKQYREELEQALA